MSDLIKRLRNAPNWMREEFGSWKSVRWIYDRAPLEAADEIEKLLEVIEMARDCIDDVDVIGARLTLTKALGEKE
jgi:hypothetical protein